MVRTSIGRGCLKKVLRIEGRAAQQQNPKQAASSSTSATSNLKPTAIYPHAMEAIGNVRQVYDGALTPEMAVATFEILIDFSGEMIRATRYI